jgi:vacuolar-type H+-ATPase subunit I/STV1
MKEELLKGLIEKIDEILEDLKALKEDVDKLKEDNSVRFEKLERKVDDIKRELDRQEEDNSIKFEKLESTIEFLVSKKKFLDSREILLSSIAAMETPANVAAIYDKQIDVPYIAR